MLIADNYLLMKFVVTTWFFTDTSDVAQYKFGDTWTDVDNDALVQAIKDRYHRLTGTGFRRVVVWQDIASILQPIVSTGIIYLISLTYYIPCPCLTLIASVIFKFLSTGICHTSFI